MNQGGDMDKRRVTIELAKSKYLDIGEDKYTEYVRLLNAAGVKAKQIKILQTTERKPGIVTIRVEIFE
jgi:hypothetical protein